MCKEGWTLILSPQCSFRLSEEMQTKQGLKPGTELKPGGMKAGGVIYPGWHCRSELVQIISGGADCKKTQLTVTGH